MKHFVIKIVLAQFIMMVCASIASAQYVQLLGYTNQSWRYNDTSTSASNPGATFMQTGFDDTVAGWKTGFPLFGNDDAGVYNGAGSPFSGGINGFRTPLDRTGGRVTFYFRTHINVASAPNANAQLYSTNYLDDSAIYYINGTEIGRMRIAAGAVTWDTLGSNPPTEGIPYRIDFPAGSAQLLQVGDNVLAVEVHQSSTGSSDCAFAMNLIVINPFPPVILDTSLPADVTVVENRPFSLQVVADASPPITYQWVHDGTDITGANSPTYSIARAQSGDAGDYYCRVSNPEGTTNSRTAHVTYIQDDTPPAIISVLSPNFTTIIVQFTESMDNRADTAGGTVLDPFNWAVTDELDNALEISSLSLSANDTVATITLGPSNPQLAEDTIYKVLVTNPILDLAGASRPEGERDPNTLFGTNVTFRTYTTAGCSGFLFEAFDTLSTPGNAVSLLTSHPNYPNNPMDRARITSFDSRHAYSADTHEQYGGRIRGLFVPYITGPWTFYLASDDASQLFVNPTGPGSAGKQLVAQELNCCNNFVPTGDPKTSVPINLTAGQPYYVEALYKEGTGGDWLKVAARPSSEPVPTGGNSEAGSVSPNVIQSSGGPAGILSGVTIASQPQSQSKIAGQTVQFSVGLSPDVPACYQWKVDNVDVTGAIGPTYQFVTAASDDGKKIRCAVSLMGGTSLLSDEATLSVTIDTTPPTVTSVSQDLSGGITVTFSEAMDLSTATNRNNYSIDGVTPASATAQGPLTVLLEPGAPMAACPASHSVIVGNVRDANGVLINPNPTAVNVTLNNLLLLPINASTTWRYNESGEELGSSWYATGFDDSGWSNGAAGLGVETATVLPPGFPIRTAINWSPVKFSVYFRKHFNLGSDPSSITNLQLHHYIDDGAVFYLNGQELTRIRIPAGPVDTNTVAGNYTETTPGVLSVDSVPMDLLLPGDNVLAARVNQSSPTSSDIVFMTAVVGQSTGCVAERPRLRIDRNGNQVTISLKSGPNGTIYRASSLAGPWSSVGAAPQTVTIGPGDAFFEIRP